MMLSDGLFHEPRLFSLITMGRENRPIDSDSRWKQLKFRMGKFPFEIKSEEI